MLLSLLLLLLLFPVVDQSTYDFETCYEHMVEAFTPPWLLQDTARPDIKTVPGDVITYGSNFNVGYSGKVSRVSLMAPSSTTHSTDFTQRLVYLKIVSQAGDQMTLQAPPNATIALQGYHMLFLLNGDTPSVAKWVRLG